MGLLDKYYFSSKNSNFYSPTELVLNKAKDLIRTLYSSHPRITILVVSVLALNILVGSFLSFRTFNKTTDKNSPKKNILGVSDPSAKPTLKSFHKGNTVPTFAITIEGNNLGIPKGNTPPFTYPGRILFSPGSGDTLEINSVEGLPSAWEEDQVTVFVPTTAQEGKIFIVYNFDGEEFVTNGLKFKPNKLEPKIEKISPDQGTPSTLISVKGKGFGNEVVGNPQFSNPPVNRYPGRVLFGKAEGIISSWIDHEINLFVPNGADQDSIKIVIDSFSDNVESKEVSFGIHEPSALIEEISPNKATNTELVVIKGKGFGNTMTSLRDGSIYPGKISFGEVEGIISSWADHDIFVFLPAGLRPGKIDTKIERFYKNKLKESNTAVLEVKKPEPVIKKVSPDQGTPSTIVTIEGEGFGNEIKRVNYPTVYPGQVFFGGTVAIPLNGGWSNNKISVYVPLGAKVNESEITVKVSFEKASHRFTIKKPNVKVESIEPTEFFPGQVVTLKGKGFGNQIINSNFPVTYPGHVLFDAQKAMPVPGSWTEEGVSVFAPFNALDGEVEVVSDSNLGTVKSNKLSYKVKKPEPKIDAASLIKVGGDRILVINGNGFNEVSSNPYIGKQFPGSVLLSADGTKEKAGRSKVWVAADSWSNNSIVVRLPKNIFGVVFIEMNYKNGLVYSNGLEPKSR